MNKLIYLFLTTILCACGSKSTEQKISKDEVSSLNTKPTEKHTAKEEVNSSNSKTVSKVFKHVSHYQGKIDGKDEVYLYISTETSSDNNGLSGFYYHTKNEVNITLDGELNNGKINLEASVYDSKSKSDQTKGYFEGTIDKNTFSGTWFSSDRTKQFPFTLTNTANPIASPIVSFENKSEYYEGKIIINDKEALLFQTKMGSTPYGVMEDINMDGYYDLRVLTGINFYGSPLFNCWLYNPSIQKYEESLEYSTVLNDEMVFDAYKKELTCSWRESKDSYISTIHKIVNGQPLLTEKIISSIDEETEKEINIRTTFNIVGGKSVQSKIDIGFPHQN